MIVTDRDHTTAVLVVDLQVGVVAECVDAEGTVARVAALVERARSLDVPIVFVQHEDPDLPHGSADWQLAPPLAAAAGEHMVFKQYRDSFVETDLAAVLSALGVTRLVITGAQPGYCVRTTAQRAPVEGYDVVLVSDGHTTWDTSFAGVAIGGAQIVAHTNQYFSGWAYPGRSITLARHDEVELGATLDPDPIEPNH